MLKNKNKASLLLNFFSKKQHSISLSNEHKQLGERLSNFANENGAKKVKISPANFLFGKINRKFDFFSPSSKKKKQHFLAFLMMPIVDKN